MNDSLNFIDIYGIFSGLRHTPLLMTGLVMGSGFLAMGLIPISLIYLFLPPFDSNGVSYRIRLCIGLFLFVLGLLGFGLLLGIIFLS